MSDDKPRDGAAQAAADTVVRELASYAVMFAVGWALMNRDAVTRLWTALSRRPVPPAEARARRLCADLARAVSAWEHETDRSPSVPGDGLYGRR